MGILRFFGWGFVAMISLGFVATICKVIAYVCKEIHDAIIIQPVFFGITILAGIVGAFWEKEATKLYNDLFEK